MMISCSDLLEMVDRLLPAPLLVGSFIPLILRLVFFCFDFMVAKRGGL